MKITPISLIYLMLCLLIFSAPLCLCSGAYAEDIIIDIGNGSGEAGSHDSPITLTLDNSADMVKGVQVYICDEGNYLTVKNCVGTDRASGFICSLNECSPDSSSSECRLYPGCANIVLYAPGEVIDAGSGPIALINYDVSENAPTGCVTLNPEKAIVSDENRKTLNVLAEAGEFCITGEVTTTSICKDPCCIEQIYGEASEQTDFLRNFRDNVLSKTQEGRELIQLYYQWSPVIVRAMEEDEEFKEEVKQMIDGVLPTLVGTASQN